MRGLVTDPEFRSRLMAAAPRHFISYLNNDLQPMEIELLPTGMYFGPEAYRMNIEYMESLGIDIETRKDAADDLPSMQ